MRKIQWLCILIFFSVVANAADSRAVVTTPHYGNPAVVAATQQLAIEKERNTVARESLQELQRAKQ
ncbi:MAG: hypothetical protein ACNA7Y_01690, partial [Gammaproteobacteria bacterium]